MGKVPLYQMNGSTLLLGRMTEVFRMNYPPPPRITVRPWILDGPLKGRRRVRRPMSEAP